MAVPAPAADQLEVEAILQEDFVFVLLQVDKILKPGLQPGAADVFLDFLSYSSGPLPEEQLAAVTVPVSMLWGDKDPWYVCWL